MYVSVKKIFSFVILSFLWASTSEARVFKFQSEHVGAYFRGYAGTSRAHKNAYKSSSGSQTSFGDEVPYNLGGEFGFIMSMQNTLNIRLGIEVYETKPLKRLQGKSSGGVKYFDLASEVFTYSPVVNAEFNFHATDTSRAFISAGMGWTSVSLKNTYSGFTSDNPYSVTTNYTEKGTANVVSWQLGVGYETLFVDTVTVAFEAGYKHMPVSEFKYTNSSVSTFQGVKTKGDKLVNDDGTTRSMDLSSVWVGIGFRFYIETL